MRRWHIYTHTSWLKHADINIAPNGSLQCAAQPGALLGECRCSDESNHELAVGYFVAVCRKERHVAGILKAAEGKMACCLQIYAAIVPILVGYTMAWRKRSLIANTWGDCGG